MATAPIHFSNVAQNTKKFMYLLFWLQVSVNDANFMKMIKSNGQFSKIKFNIFLSEHHLQNYENLSLCHLYNNIN